MSAKVKTATLDSLMAEFGADSAAEFEFEIKGQKFRAVAVTDASRMIALEKKAKTWLDTFAKKHYPAELKPLAEDAAPEVVKMALFCEALLVEPKLSFADCLKVAKTCGMLLPEIFGKIMDKSKGVIVDSEMEAIEDEKND